MNERTREEEAATYAAAAAAEQTNQTAAAAEGKVVKSFFGAGKALRPATATDDDESYVFALGIDPI